MGNLQAQCNVSVPVLVVSLEYVRHALETDARLNKQIKRDCILAAAVVGAVQQRDKLLREAVSKGDERFVELRIRYTAAVVLVEAVEEGAPS